MASPISDRLEKQRRDLVAAYQSTLEEIRRVHDESIKGSQGISGHGTEIVVKTYDFLQGLSKHARRLTTRLRSYEDRREDLEAWHQVSQMASALSATAQTIRQVYGNAEMAAEIGELWTVLASQLDAQSGVILDIHGAVGEQIETCQKRVAEWLESRRDDFERQCREYQLALTQAGIAVDLRVPFDQENPSESYAALVELVVRHVYQYFEVLVRKLNSALQIIHYGIRVQRLPLSDAENQVRDALQQASKLGTQLTPECIKDSSTFKARILQELITLTEDGRGLDKQVQQALQQRPAEGGEGRLLELLRMSSAGQPIDLRGLIIRLLDAGEQDVDLDMLMKDLQSLFQKNQIAIHINLLQGEGQ